MQRVLLIGPGGAGKSTVARLIAERLALPLIHLDALYWQPGWIAMPNAQWEPLVTTLIAKPAWVMDGNFGGTLQQRLGACDTVLLFDLPPLQCLARVLTRRWRFRGRARPGMRAGCVEKLDLEFVWWILSYRWVKLPRVLALLEQAKSRGVRVLHFTRQSQVDAFLHRLRKGVAIDD